MLSLPCGGVLRQVCVCVCVSARWALFCVPGRVQASLCSRQKRIKPTFALSHSRLPPPPNHHQAPAGLRFGRIRLPLLIHFIYVFVYLFNRPRTLCLSGLVKCHTCTLTHTHLRHTVSVFRPPPAFSRGLCCVTVVTQQRRCTDKV